MRNPNGNNLDQDAPPRGWSVYSTAMSAPVVGSSILGAN